MSELEPKKANINYLLNNLNLNRIQSNDINSLITHVNNSFESIMRYTGNVKLTVIPEFGFFIKNPENGIIVRATGYIDVVNGEPSKENHNTGWNPLDQEKEWVTGGAPGDGRGLYIYDGVGKRPDDSDRPKKWVKIIDLPL